jgi:hypothetical protein
MKATLYREVFRQHSPAPALERIEYPHEQRPESCQQTGVATADIGDVLSRIEETKPDRGRAKQLGRLT